MDVTAQGRASVGSAARVPTEGTEQPGRGRPAGVGSGGWITPDAVELEVAVATVGSRGIAALIDLSILAVGFLLIGLGQELFGFAGFVPGWFGIAVLLLAAFTLQFAYPIGFEVLWRGRTLGKAAMGLRVVTEEGSPVGFRHSAVRAVLGLVDLTGTLGLVAITSSMSSSRGQRLGDLAAGTIVIRERRVSRGPLSMSFQPPQGCEHYVSTLDMTSLDARDRAAVRDTLRRLPSLPAKTREQVLYGLAMMLSPRVMPAAPQGMPAEIWLRCVAAALEARGRAGDLARRAAAPPGFTSPAARPRYAPTAPPPPPGYAPPATQAPPPSYAPLAAQAPPPGYAPPAVPPPAVAPASTPARATSGQPPDDASPRDGGFAPPE